MTGRGERRDETARCACGAVSVVVEGEPAIRAVCHCDDCRRRTGSAFGVSLYFPAAAVVALAGETRVYAFHHAERDHDQQRYFCAVCGTTLYWRISTMPDLIGIAGGCFADLSRFPPNHSHVDSRRAPWLCLPDDWKTTG